MKKAILISIRPEWVAKILNGEKTIEIRKTMPKCRFPIDVYIYCSKGKSLQECEFWSFEYPGSFKAFVAFSEEFPVGKEQFFLVEKDSLEFDGDYLATIGEKVRQEINDFESSSFEASPSVNGKVVAKFTLNKIENFVNGMNELEREWDGKPDAEYDYFAYEKALEKACLTYEEADKYCPDQSFYAWHISDLEVFDEPKELDEFGLKRAPQSWQFVEVEK